MKRTAIIATFTVLLCTRASGGDVTDARHDGPARDTHNAALRLAEQEPLNDHMTRLAVQAMAADPGQLTPQEKLGLLIFVSAAQQSAKHH